jgi:hypothetical protein
MPSTLARALKLFIMLSLEIDVSSLLGIDVYKSIQLASFGREDFLKLVYCRHPSFNR